SLAALAHRCRAPQRSSLGSEGLSRSRSRRILSTKKYTPRLNTMSTMLNAPTNQSVNRTRRGLDIVARLPGAEYSPLRAWCGAVSRSGLHRPFGVGVGCKPQSGWKKDRKLRPKHVPRSRLARPPDQHGARDSRAAHIPWRYVG